MANNTTKKGIAAGVLAAAAAAGAAAGYYFYASDDAKKHRRIAAKWARDMKNEIVREAKKAKNIDRKQLLAIIDGAAAAYETVRAVNPADVRRAAREMKDNWQLVARDAGAAISTAVKKKVPRSASRGARKRTTTAAKTSRRSPKRRSR